MSPDAFLKNYIDGKLFPPDSSQYIDNYQPSTGKVYSHIPDSDAGDVQQAVSAAEKSFPRLVWDG